MTKMAVQYLDHMGNDLSVINSAKASFGKYETEFNSDEHPRLINYLARGMTQGEHRTLVDRLADCTNPEWVGEQLEQYRHTPTHHTPFCHTAITIRLKAPIAIHAQFMKHTVGFSHNTVSRRYVSDTSDVFMPTFRTKSDGNIKQDSGEVITELQVANRRQMFKKQTVTQTELQHKYDRVCNSLIDFYNELIEMGVAPEQACLVLPQGVMTEWVSTGSLYAWARFYNQCTDPHAQKEIQELAHMIGVIIEPLFPVSWQALTKPPME